MIYYMNQDMFLFNADLEEHIITHFPLWDVDHSEDRLKIELKNICKFANSSPSYMAIHESLHDGSCIDQ